MDSKASLQGHPVHPMLVAFPVASYVFTFAALVGFAATRDPFWYRASMVVNLVGVVTAVLAAIPGIIDLVSVVPAGTTARRTGSIHAIAHVNALVLFGINLAMSLRLSAAGKPPVLLVALILTGAGVLLTAAGGYFGWKLVQRHHIGVAAVADLEPHVARSWMEGAPADDENTRSTAELRPRQ
jgi:uncharacterized membrane protein